MCFMTTLLSDGEAVWSRPLAASKKARARET
jgi:hypothetical protein